MKTDRNICPSCSAKSTCRSSLCKNCGEVLVYPSFGAIAIWRLGEVRKVILDGIVREIEKSFRLPVVIQPCFLDPSPSRRPAWNGASATAFLNQVERRSGKGTVFSVGITEENIVPGAGWNYLFGYAYLGLPSCAVSLHPLSSDRPKPSLLIRRAAAIAIHEIGHNCGLDHHCYDDNIACVMTADTSLDCLELVDQGTHKFCTECQSIVDHKLASQRQKIARHYQQ